MVETGTSHSAAGLWQLLRDRAIAPEQVRYVIPTHVHLDHAGGAGTMMAALPGAQLLIHPRGARHMIDPGRLVEASKAVYGEELFEALYGVVEPVAAERVRQVEDGDSVSLSGRRLEFRHTRGHAEHHVCIWDETSRGWFSGDMFGVSYPWCRFSSADFVLPSTTPSQFDPEAYLASLALLAGYSPQRMYLTHYGELAYSEPLAKLLAQQIESYCAFAGAHAGDAAALQQCLSEYTSGLLQQVDASVDAEQLERHLAFDMQLNAQGLQAWQQRLARV